MCRCFLLALLSVSLYTLITIAGDSEGEITSPGILDRAVKYRLATLRVPKGCEMPRSLLRELELLYLLDAEKTLRQGERLQLLQYATRILDLAQGEEEAVLDALRARVCHQLRGHFLTASTHHENVVREQWLRRTWDGAVPLLDGPEEVARLIYREQETLARILAEVGGKEDHFRYRDHVSSLVRRGFPARALAKEAVRKAVAARYRELLRATTDSGVENLRLRKRLQILGLSYYQVRHRESTERLPKTEVWAKLAAVQRQDDFLALAPAIEDDIDDAEARKGLANLFSRAEHPELLRETSYCILLSGASWSSRFLDYALATEGQARREAVLDVLGLWMDHGVKRFWSEILSAIAEPQHDDVDEALCKLLADELGVRGDLSETQRRAIAFELARRLAAAKSGAELLRLLRVARNCSAEWDIITPSLWRVVELGSGSDTAKQFWSLLGRIGSRNSAVLAKALRAAEERGAKNLVLKGVSPGLATSPQSVSLIAEEAKSVSDRETLSVISHFLSQQEQLKTRWQRNGFLDRMGKLISQLEASVKEVERLDEKRRELLAHRIDFVQTTLERRISRGTGRKSDISRTKSYIARCKALREKIADVP